MKLRCAPIPLTSLLCTALPDRGERLVPLLPCTTHATQLPVRSTTKSGEKKMLPKPVQQRHSYC